MEEKTKKRQTKKLKNINCHPKIKNKTISKKSCMTPEVLNDLKTAFNKSYPKIKIKSNTSNVIWSELKDKIQSCNREDCWLSEIKELKEKDKNKIKKELFAPYQPEDWKTNPSTWLSNFDILEVLQQYESAYPYFKFIGPSPIDFDSKPTEYNDKCVWKDLCTFQLKDFVKEKFTKIGVVFNLDKHNQPGSHWTSLFVDLEDRFIFYFDSAGEKMPKEIESLVKRIINQGLYLITPIKFDFYETWNSNEPIVHQFGNNECGMYSLYFIICMLKNEKEPNKKFRSLQDKLNHFLKKRIPDKYVFQKRGIYFNN